MNTAPLLLTYNLTSEKQLAIEVLCLHFGIRIRAVSAGQYMEPIETLTGPERATSTGTLYQGPSFTDEMLLFSGFPDEDLHGFLTAYRQEGIGKINLKAAVTPYNIKWNSLELQNELKREHEELKKSK